MAMTTWASMTSSNESATRRPEPRSPAPSGAHEEGSASGTPSCCHHAATSSMHLPCLIMFACTNRPCLSGSCLGLERSARALSGNGGGLAPSTGGPAASLLQPFRPSVCSWGQPPGATAADLTPCPRTYSGHLSHPGRPAGGRHPVCFDQGGKREAAAVSVACLWSAGARRSCKIAGRLAPSQAITRSGSGS